MFSEPELLAPPNSEFCPLVGDFFRVFFCLFDGHNQFQMLDAIASVGSG